VIGLLDLLDANRPRLMTNVAVSVRRYLSRIGLGQPRLGCTSAMTFTTLNVPFSGLILASSCFSSFSRSSIVHRRFLTNQRHLHKIANKISRNKFTHLRPRKISRGIKPADTPRSAIRSPGPLEASLYPIFPLCAC
jgi:hypothetical protein